MDYKEALFYIENTGKFGINLGLKRIERLCELLGNPQKSLKVIHVAGTNGKGSTTSFIASMLIKQGYRVGIYTSPYIERFTERIKINNDEINEEEIAKLVTDIEPLVEKISSEGMDHPTEFEIITACAFKYFYEMKVDFVVLEVGLGGRFDATNVVDPVLSVITTISYDHMNVLGNSLAKIAFEKGGIIKSKRPVVIYPQEQEAMDVLLEIAHDKGSKVYNVDEFNYEIVENNIDGIVFNIIGKKEYTGLKIKLLGEHQVLNALTALKSIEVLKGEGYKIENESIKKGLEEARWPGRFEIIKKDPLIVLDGGHNIQGIDSLVKGVKHYFPGKKIKIVCGMLKDKEYKSMLNMLFNISDFFITVTPDSPRALSANDLKDEIIKNGGSAIASKSIENAVEIAVDNVDSGEVMIFCGSLYMIGKVRTILLK